MEDGRKQLQDCIKSLEDLLKNFQPSDDLPDWVDEKIGKAFECLKSVQDHLESDEDLEKSDNKPFHGYNKEKHSRTGGLSEKERKKVNRETGSNLKRPVTGKVKAGSKDAKRRKSFCARMSGVPGPTSKDGKLTRKGAALRRWKCSKSLEILNKSDIDRAVIEIKGDKKVNEVLANYPSDKKAKILEKLRNLKKAVSKACN
jgi:hypothetical protein